MKTVIILFQMTSHLMRKEPGKPPKWIRVKRMRAKQLRQQRATLDSPGRPDVANGPEYAAPGLWFRGHWDWAVLMLEWEGPMPCFLGGGYALQTMMSIFFKICPTLNYLYFNMGGQQCHVKSWLSKWKTQVQWTSFRCSKLCMNCSVW